MRRHCAASVPSFWVPAQIPRISYSEWTEKIGESENGGKLGTSKKLLSSRLAESPDPCNGWMFGLGGGTFTACSGAACACSQRHYRLLVPPLVLAFDRPVQAVEGLRNDRPLRLERLLLLVGG